MRPGQAERAKKLDRRAAAEIVRVAARLVETFEVAAEVLQEAQDLVPAPLPGEVAEMRQGTRPLTREAFLMGLFQRAMVGAENLASDLRAITEKGALREVHRIELSMLELNAIEEAVTRRSP
jgi:hypothetical protein